MKLPRPVFFLAAGVFVLFVVALTVALGVFFWHGTDFWDSFEVAGTVRVAVAVLGGLMVSSGLLFFYHSQQESYTTFEEVFFRVCCCLALGNLLWLVPVLFFI